MPQWQMTASEWQAMEEKVTEKVRHLCKRRNLQLQE
jgi:hypothetical protein